MKYSLTIKPAIPPEIRHQLEDVLDTMGFHVWGGGTNTDMSSCDITFESIDTVGTSVSVDRCPYCGS